MIPTTSVTAERKPGVLISGPQGSGKTRHAEALRLHYGLARLLDDDSWQPGDPIPADTLVLTNFDDARAVRAPSAQLHNRREGDK